jgi:hypothetical protein
VTDPTPPPPGPSGQWPSDAPASQPGPWASDYRSPAAGPMTKPQTILQAVKLMYVGAGLTVVGVLASLLQLDTIRDSIEDSDSSLTSSEVDSAVAFTIGFLVVTALVSIGLWLWMASANGSGKSWARVVATVLGGLNILFTLLSVVSGGATPLSLVISLVNLALAGYILWLLWRPESTQYYEAMSR